MMRSTAQAPALRLLLIVGMVVTVLLAVNGYEGYKHTPVTPCTCENDDDSYCRCPRDQEEYSESSSDSGCEGSDCDITNTFLYPNCTEDVDSFGIMWPSTMSNFSMINCSNGTVQDFHGFSIKRESFPTYFSTCSKYTKYQVVCLVCRVGIASRECDRGVWIVPSVGNCSSDDYRPLRALRIQVEQAESASAVASGLHELISQLTTVSDRTDERTSTYPADLMTANSLLKFILETIEQHPNILNSNETVQNIADCFSNILSFNDAGWRALESIYPGQTQMLLSNSEGFALLLAENLKAVGLRKIVESESIIITAELVDPNNIIDINFPGGNDDFITQGNSIFIPASYIEEQHEQQPNRNGVPVFNIYYQNIERILPQPPFSQVLSSQVSNEPSKSNDIAVELTFTVTDTFIDDDIFTPHCAFWNFSRNEGRGGWDTEGVSVMEINPNDSTITCNSTHLTTFAIILEPFENNTDPAPDVSIIVDVTSVRQDLSAEERIALSAVSYVGCGVSIVCLIVTLIVLVYYRNNIFKGTHNFIHLNLALALLFALITFVSGVGTATRSEVGCTIVAALLHYFFTAVFTWMLCEGIMIYLLLVKIFKSSIGERKLLYLALGWGIPIPIVAISAGVAHSQYGNDNFCWIDTQRGAIWGFVAPMLAIIFVNIIILILTICSLYKNRKTRMHMTSEKSSQVVLVKSILKATILLLPLLGVTWVLGLLAVNQESSVFAWLFTILNSLQGMFIFIFHVIRKDEIWEKISSYWKRKDKSSSMPSGQKGSMSEESMKTVGSQLSLADALESPPKTDNVNNSGGIDSECKSFDTEALAVEVHMSDALESPPKTDNVNNSGVIDSECKSFDTEALAVEVHMSDALESPLKSDNVNSSGGIDSECKSFDTEALAVDVHMSDTLESPLKSYNVNNSGVIDSECKSFEMEALTVEVHMSDALELPLKSDNVNSSGGIDSERKSFEMKALAVEADNEEPEKTDTDTDSEAKREEELIAETISVDVRESCTYHDTTM